MSKPLIIAAMAFTILPGALGYYNTSAPARAPIVQPILLPAGAVPAGKWIHRPGLGDYRDFMGRNQGTFTRPADTTGYAAPTNSGPVTIPTESENKESRRPSVRSVYNNFLK